MLRSFFSLMLFFFLSVLSSDDLSAQVEDTLQIEITDNRRNSDLEDYEDDYYEDVTQRKVIMLDFMLDIGFPQRAFKDRLNKTAIGFDFTVLFQMKLHKPGFLGLDFYGYPIDRESDLTIDFVNGNAVELERSIKNWITGTDLVYRYYPSFNIPVIEPYFEALIGFKWIFSTYEITDIFDDTSLNFEFVESSWSFSYGFSFGFQIYLGDRFYFNSRTTYIPGNSVSYLARIPDANGSNTNSPLDYFETKNSSTDMIRFQLGVSIVFP